MFRQKLLKRVMPLLLSAVMVLQSVPGTVSAAELLPSEAAESALTDTDEDLGEFVSDGSDVAGETLPQAVFEVDWENFTQRLYGCTYDYTTGIVEAEYEKENPAYAAAVQNAVTNALSVWVDGAEEDALKAQVKYTWKKYESGSFVDMAAGTKPHDAGIYSLEVSLDAVDGICGAAESFDTLLEVKPAVIALEVERNITPGSTVSDVKRANEYKRVYVHGAWAVRSDYVQSVSWQVRYAHADEDSKELEADTAVLQKNKDYLLAADVTLKDAVNYTVEQDTFNIVFGASVATKIDVTYATEEQVIGKVYDGEEFAFNAEKSEYTAKVVYTGADGSQQELAGAEIKASWCNAEKKEYWDKQFVPTDAGVYYCRLSYTDENGSYADSEAYVRVEIRMADIVVDPQPLADENKVYEGMTAAEVLKNVTYKVYCVRDGVVSADEEEVDEYFWGTAYSQNLTKEQSYEPVFALEEGRKDADGKVVWSTLNRYETLVKSDDISYRIVFTGQKTVYNTDGSVGTLVDINSSQGNFCVDATEDAIEKYAETIQVLPSSLVVIDASAIPMPVGAKPSGTGDGDDFAKPIVKVYDGNDLYKTKGEYKKAVVKAAAEGGSVPADADSMLVYTWQKAASWDVNEQGQWYVDEWTTVSYHHVEVTSSPFLSDVYRLRISLDDPTNTFHAEPVYRYYVIRPQDIVAVLTGAPAIYADGLNTVEDFIYSIQNDDAEDAKTYVGLEIYPVTLTKDAQTGKGIAAKGEKPLQNSYVNTFIEGAYGTTEFFYVERKETEGENAGSWVRCNSWDVFEKDAEYRLCIENPYTNSNYNMGRELDVHNRVLDSEYYPNESIAITCKNTQALEVAISFDESKITGNTKTYDGKPFESLDALKNLVKVTAVADNADVTDKVKDKLRYVFYNTDLGLGYPEQSAIHAGNYSVSVMLETDDTYKRAVYILNTPYVIEKKTLTVTPKLREDIPAGLRLYGSTPAVGSIVESYEITGYAECDQEAVDQGRVLEMTSWNVYERTVGTSTYNGILRSSERYYVLSGYCDVYSRQDAAYSYEWVSYGNDYEIKSAQVAFVPVRKAAAVGQNGIALKDQVQDAEGKYSHTITADEGIPYRYQGLTIDGVKKEGNFFQFRLYAPGDFWEKNNSGESWEDMGIVYENRIEQANGYVLNSGWENRSSDISEQSCYQPYITVVFDASKKETSGFEIVWAENYVESFTVDLKNCILEADFREAVAPKSIAFNGASTKMAVGDTQQLDVKLTKAQMSDTILLGYSSSDEQVLKVSESGFVTALSASKSAVTVEVYPCRLVDGVKTPIGGAKHAKVKIKVSDVAVPKISKVTPKDTTAVISYKKPVNGYRREIYVLEGKKTVQQFEDAIAEVKNGDLSGFVYTRFVTSEVTDKKGVAAYEVDNLLPGTGKASEYTVYVRNVAGLRKLDNDSQVAVSHAGAVKTFKTIKSQTTALDVYFDAAAKGQTAFYGYYDDESDRYIYSAPITGKSAKVSVKARFYEKYSQSYSDDADYIWRSLPLTSDVKKNYTLPKMAYYVTEDYDGRLTYNEWAALSNAARAGYFYCADGYYYQKAAIAAINKSGKVAFKGKGKVYIIAADTNTGISDMAELYITANPDTVTAKAVKMIPGQTVSLADILNYQERKIKIVNYGAAYGDLNTDQISNEDFKIEEDLTDYGRDYHITALKPGAKLEFQVTDAAVAANGGRPVTVKLTTAAVEPVKNLKAGAVYDDHFTMTFSYPKASYDFRVELKDARGRVIFNDLDTHYGTYDAKAKRYIYELAFNNSAITRLSNYTVAVTAVCNGASSKEAKRKVKTTNIPASYYNLSAVDYDGGCEIEVTTDNNGSIDLSDYPVLKTGNTYTLSINVDNLAAKQRLTDTLKWKSTNAKVAAVKANPGSYTAQFKAVKQGETTIEVTSKITKKVIARWRVTVNATGEADGYFGDNEPYNGKASIGDGVTINGKDVLEVTTDHTLSVTLNKGEEQWFVFTAPAYGEFRFTASPNAGVYDEFGNYIANAAYSSAMLEKNTKRYIRIQNNNSSRVNGSVTVRFTSYQEIFLGENRVKAGKCIWFRATEDNYYTFTRVDGNTERVLDRRSLSENGTWSLDYVTGTVGKEYTVLVTKREPQAVTVGEEVPVTLSAGEEKWYAFTVETANRYKVYSTEATGRVRAKWYNRLKDTGVNSQLLGSPDFNFGERSLDPGICYLCLSSDEATTDTPVTLMLHVTRREVEKSLTLEGAGERVSLVDGETKYYSYTAAEAGYYIVRAKQDADSPAAVELGYTKNLKATSFYKVNPTTPIYLEAGESMYLQAYIAADAEGATEETPAVAVITIEKAT